MNVALIGPGLVGKEFIAQIQASKLSINIIATMSSKTMSLCAQEPRLSNMQEFLHHASAYDNVVIVDCTSSDEIAKQYPSFLSKFHIITPNKKAFSSSIDLYNQIKSTAKLNKLYCLHESTVGAGLPIISTLENLIQSGDEILKIEGIFSGTLSYIFNQFDGTVPFSEVVIGAKNLGFTEPDPRDDLNGLDVARKVVILGRICGLELDVGSLDVQNIVPEALRDLGTDQFMDKLRDFDDLFDSLVKNARSRGCCLRYVGSVNLARDSRVELKEFPLDHPFAGLKGSDNIIAFYTKRFTNPLIIQGAGAGAAVTAFGMFSDLLTIMRSIGLETQ